MHSLWISVDVRGSRLAAAAILFASCWLALTPIVAAQEAEPLPITPPASSAPPAPPPKPGVFETIGRWVDEGTNAFQDHLRGAKRSMDDLGDKATAGNRDLSDQAAKVGQGAVDVIGALPLPTSVYLTSRDFGVGGLSDRAECQVGELTDALVRFAMVVPPALGPAPLATQPT